VNSNSASTTCDRARAWIADSILVPAETAEDPAAASHVAECAECRAYRDDCQTVWAALGELPAIPPLVDYRARFDDALRRARATFPIPVPAPMQRSWVTARRVLLLAASVLAAALLGFGAGSWRSALAGSGRTAVANASSDTSPRYLLLLYDDSTSANRPTADVAKLIAEYSAWARGLRTAGQLVSAEKLRDDLVQWYGGAVNTSDGARIGGFFVIRARDLADAQRIAGACPHLKHGGRVELRAIQPT
jgi:hypothetical protein